MSALHDAAQQALDAMLNFPDDISDEMFESIRALRAALAQQAEPVQEPVREPGKFDHGIGADRFKVVRGAFWWHVLIGDSTKEHGKFRSRPGAEQMAADLLREFRNGAFVQHTAPPQRPLLTDEEIDKAVAQERDALLDHIYEYGTLAEGVLERIRRLARAVERKVRGEKE